MLSCSCSTSSAAVLEFIDKIAPGALFGMVATGRSDDDVQLFYKDTLNMDQLSQVFSMQIVCEKYLNARIALS
jgi:hypothetical protein